MLILSTSNSSNFPSDDYAPVNEKFLNPRYGVNFQSLPIHQTNLDI